jgi:hypothetical protein
MDNVQRIMGSAHVHGLLRYMLDALDARHCHMCSTGRLSSPCRPPCTLPHPAATLMPHAASQWPRLHLLCNEAISSQFCLVLNSPMTNHSKQAPMAPVCIRQCSAQCGTCKLRMEVDHRGGSAHCWWHQLRPPHLAVAAPPSIFLICCSMQGSPDVLQKKPHH